jgi:hypothetical protein
MNTPPSFWLMFLSSEMLFLRDGKTLQPQLHLLSALYQFLGTIGHWLLQVALVQLSLLLMPRPRFGKNSVQNEQHPAGFGRGAGTALLFFGISQVALSGHRVLPSDSDSKGAWAEGGLTGGVAHPC